MGTPGCTAGRVGPLYEKKENCLDSLSCPCGLLPQELSRQWPLFGLRRLGFGGTWRMQALHMPAFFLQRLESRFASAVAQVHMFPLPK